MAPESRRWRIGLLAACAVAVVFWLHGLLLCSPVLPHCATTTGFEIDFSHTSAMAIVTSVEKDGPAASAGIRVGDNIDLRRIPFRERWRLHYVLNGYQLPANEHLHFVIHRGTKTLASIFTPRRVTPTWGTWTDLIGNAAAIWGICFAALLAYRRPNLVEARLLSLFLLTYFAFGTVSGLAIPSWPTIDFIIVTIGGALFFGSPPALLAAFSALFARPLSPLRRYLTGITIVFAVLTAALAAAYKVFWYLLAVPVSWYYALGIAYVFAPAYIAALACAISAVVASRGSERRRMLWVTVSITPYWVPYVVFAVFAPTFSERVNNIANVVLGVLSITMPVGLTYAVLSRRSVDIGYAINRAAVFGAVSIFVLGIFIVVEWALGSWVSSANHTTSVAISIVTALSLGLSMRFIHRRIERSVDVVFFRKRHDDEIALRRFAREAAFVTDRDTLLDRTVKMTQLHTEASSAAVLLRNGPAYTFIGNGSVGTVGENDPAIVAMRTWHEPIDLHQYETGLAGERAFPMTARGLLQGILVCSAKRSGEAYAPDESDALEAVALGVGAALAALSDNQSDEILTELRDLPRKIAELVRREQQPPPG